MILQQYSYGMCRILLRHKSVHTYVDVYVH